MATSDEQRAALQQIKAIVVGEVFPYWASFDNTTHTR